MDCNITITWNIFEYRKVAQCLKIQRQRVMQKISQCHCPYHNRKSGGKPNVQFVSRFTLCVMSLVHWGYMAFAAEGQPGMV